MNFNYMICSFHSIGGVVKISKCHSEFGSVEAKLKRSRVAELDTCKFTCFLNKYLLINLLTL